MKNLPDSCFLFCCDYTPFSHKIKCFLNIYSIFGRLDIINIQFKAGFMQFLFTISLFGRKNMQNPCKVEKGQPEGRPFWCVAPQRANGILPWNRLKTG